MRTTWNEIKDRVELKLGENVPISDFIILANEAISELSDISYLPAPVKRYPLKSIYTQEMEYRVSLSNLLKIIKNGVITLPFEYGVLSGDLSMTYSITPPTEEITYSMFMIEDKEMEGNYFNKIKINNSYNSWDDSKFVGWKGEVVFKKKLLRTDFLKNDWKRFYELKESVVIIPKNLQSIVKVEGILKDKTLITFDKIGILDLTMDNLDFNRQDWSYLFFRNNKELHLISNVDIKEVRLYYIREMNKIKKTDVLSEIFVDFVDGYENLLTLLIAHKFLVNDVGSQDFEAQFMYKAFTNLKTEYLNNNQMERIGKKQTSIEIV